MKYIAGAIVTTALIGASLAGDLSDKMSVGDSNVWDSYATIAVLVFFLACIFGDD